MKASRNDDLYRSTSRLVNFSDGVMAIAATLLVLPLVSNISQFHSTSWQSLLDANGNEIFIFLLSFAIICRLWIIHHNIFDRLKQFNGILFWLNAMWLLTIVFLPFATELLGSTTEFSSLATGVYVGTLVVTTYVGVLLQWQIGRHPEIQKEPTPARQLLIPALVAASVMSIIFVIAVSVPNIGPWALCLLFLNGPLTKLFLK